MQIDPVALIFITVWIATTIWLAVAIVGSGPERVEARLTKKRRGFDHSSLGWHAKASFWPDPADHAKPSAVVVTQEPRVVGSQDDHTLLVRGAALARLLLNAALKAAKRI
jgi:hypothetical protein